MSVGKTIYLAILFSVVAYCSFGADISGRVYDAINKKPLPGVTIIIKGTTKGAVTDEQGRYTIKKVDNGTYTLIVSALGFQNVQRTVTLKANESAELKIYLEEDIEELESVVVTGKSESRRLAEQPIKVASIDTRVLKAEATNAIGVLTRVSGVRVRQTGGLGSNAEIQLNGLTGNAVRQYYDGIPLELLGGGIQLNNIPVNAVDRIDVYKGVMPIEIGTDALAGGINLVPKEIYTSYMDASYEVGSFNTHVVAINGAKMINERLFVGLNAFYNYSDNDYEMRDIPVARTEVITFPNGSQATDVVETTESVRRFHNQHQSSFAEVQVGMNNLRWADRIVLSAGFSQRFDEIQHGARISNRPVGELERDNQTFFQSIQYQKEFNEKLKLKYFGNYAIINDGVNDSTRNIYNWFGEIETGVSLGDGAELLAEPSLRDGRTFVTVHRIHAEYNFAKNYSFGLSNFYAYQRITGNDPVARRVPRDNPTTDPNTLPSELQRNILAAQLSGKWFEQKLELLTFGKYYSYDNTSSDFDQAGGSVIFDPVTEADEQFGFGTGVKYSFTDNLFLRFGYERAIRIPTSGEVFGDFVTIAPNFSLKPERSNNLNVGAFYRVDFSKSRFLSLQLDLFSRDQKDLIRLDLPGNPNAPAVFINQAEVESKGVEVSLKASPVKKLTLDLNYTFQEVLNAQEPDDNNTNDGGKPIPNIPTEFYNVGMRYSFNSPLGSADEITVFSYFNHVKEFSLIFEGGIRVDENFIPTQNQLDAGLSYKLNDSGFTFSLQANNVSNEQVFDNYRIPRPGRNYRIKIRYQL